MRKKEQKRAKKDVAKSQKILYVPIHGFIRKALWSRQILHRASPIILSVADSGLLRSTLSLYDAYPTQRALTYLRLTHINCEAQRTECVTCIVHLDFTVTALCT